MEPAPERHLAREIYDGESKATLPGRLVRSEGEDATGDADVDAAYDGQARSTTSISTSSGAT